MTAPTLRRAAGRTALLVFAVTLAWALPALDRPVHVDEDAALVSASLVARDPVNPYRAAARLGSDERVRAGWVRSVPPPLGWPYILTAVRAITSGTEPSAVRLVALLPLAALAALGLSALTHRFSRRPVLAALAVALSPPFAAAAASLWSDLPALGVGLFGLALLVRGTDRGERVTALAGGLFAGGAATVGFGGLVYPGLAVIYAATRGPAGRAALPGIAAAALGPAVWAWQALEAARIGAAVGPMDPGPAGGALGMLAVNAVLLPGCLPLLAWAALSSLADSLRERRASPWIGLVVACALAMVLPRTATGVSAAGVAFAISGLVATGALAGRVLSAARESVGAFPSGLAGDDRFHADRLFLGAWALAVPVASAAAQSYAAWRFLLPALPPAAMLVAGLKGGKARRPAVPVGQAAAAVALGGLVAVLVWVADLDLARAGAGGPALVAAAVPAPVETVWVAPGGGVGWALERAGHPVLGPADLRHLPPGTRVITRAEAPAPGWLRRGTLEACALPEAEIPLWGRTPLRTMDREAGAGFHSTWLGLLPVAWARRPLDVLTVWRIEASCVPGVGRIRP